MKKRIIKIIRKIIGYLILTVFFVGSFSAFAAAFTIKEALYLFVGAIIGLLIISIPVGIVILGIWFVFN